MFQTRRLKAEDPYFSKILMRARSRAPPRANFWYRAPENRKFAKIDFFLVSRNFWRAHAPKCACANFFEKFNVSALQRRVSRVFTTYSYFLNAFKRFFLFFENKTTLFSKINFFKTPFTHKTLKDF